MSSEIIQGYGLLNPDTHTDNFGDNASGTDRKIMTKEGEFEPQSPVNVEISYKKPIEAAELTKELTLNDVVVSEKTRAFVADVAKRSSAVLSWFGSGRLMSPPQSER